MPSGVKLTSSRLRLLLPTGPRLCPLSPPPIRHWSSPSTDPTTLPWCRTRSSLRCQATTSPCSCGSEGAAPTSSPRPLRPEGVARMRRPSCAALSRTVRYITGGGGGSNNILIVFSNVCSLQRALFLNRAEKTLLLYLLTAWRSPAQIPRAAGEITPWKKTLNCL